MDIAIRFDCHEAKAQTAAMAAAGAFFDIFFPIIRTSARVTVSGNLANRRRRGENDLIEMGLLDRRDWTQRQIKGGKRKKAPGGSAEVLEKARFGQGNPRKSKPFPLIFLARLGWILPDLAKFGSGLGFAWADPSLPCQTPPIAAKFASAAR
jgi:hypothetical protein